MTGTGRWAGPRKFEAWLEWLAEREMDNVGKADAAAIPSVSCMPHVCDVFFDNVCADVAGVHRRRRGEAYAHST